MLFRKELELATNNLSILFVASEVEGLIKSGGLVTQVFFLLGPEYPRNSRSRVRLLLPECRYCVEKLPVEIAT